jgi:AcrR family transcriptional regulator
MWDGRRHNHYDGDAMSPRDPAQNERMRRRSREAILRAALELFAERGFAGTTVAEVAERAGVSKGLIYAYVESKEELLRAILEERVRRAEAVLARAAVAGSPSDRLRRILRASMVDVRDHADELRLYVALRLQPESAPGVAEGAVALLEDRRGVEDVLELALGELGSSDPVGDGVVVRAALDGVAVWVLIATASGAAVSDAWIDGMVDRLARRFGA